MATAGAMRERGGPQRGAVTRGSPGTALAGTVIESRRSDSAGAGAVIELTGNAISVLFKLFSAPSSLSAAAGPLCSSAPTSLPLRQQGQAAAPPGSPKEINPGVPWEAGQRLKCGDGEG